MYKKKFPHDYILEQLYPSDDLGKKFYDEAQDEARKEEEELQQARESVSRLREQLKKETPTTVYRNQSHPDDLKFERIKKLLSGK